MIENSDVLRKLLTILLRIASRRTTEGYAFFIMDSLLKKLQKKYSLLKYINIKDTRFLEDVEAITVFPDVDSISPNEVGTVVRSVILEMHGALGASAGPFFYKEIARNLGSNHRSTMMNMGVDLNLMQLAYEVSKLERRVLDLRKSPKKIH